MQEYVLDPGMGPTGVEGWGAVGCSPVPVLCQVIFVEQVLEDFVFWWGFFNFFFPLPLFLFPLFTSLPKYSASQLRWGAGSAAWRTWGPSLHPRGAAQRGWVGERGC